MIMLNTTYVDSFLINHKQLIVMKKIKWISDVENNLWVIHTYTNILRLKGLKLMMVYHRYGHEYGSVCI